MQEFNCERGAYDIIWATHALYAVPKNELKDALRRFIFGMARSGFIAHASKESHYLNFYRHYLNGFKGGSGEPYSSAEQIIQMLKEVFPLKLRELLTKMVYLRMHLYKLRDTYNVVSSMTQSTLKQC